jgi:hypothetical protein
MKSAYEKEHLTNGHANGVPNGDAAGLKRVLYKRKIPLRTRIVWQIEDFVDDIDWMHILCKTILFGYFFFVCYIAWQVLPVRGHWTRPGQFDKIPIAYQTFPE